MVDSLVDQRCPFCSLLGDARLSRMPMRRLGDAIIARRPDTSPDQLLTTLCNYAESNKKNSVRAPRGVFPSSPTETTPPI